jgi:hypothetical protein
LRQRQSGFADGPADEAIIDRCNLPTLEHRDRKDWRSSWRAARRGRRIRCPATSDSDLPKVCGTTAPARTGVGFPQLDDDQVDFSLRLAPALKLKG